MEGGIRLHVREDIPAKVLSHNFPSESIYIEIILHNKKWLLNCSYNSNNNNISTQYENVLLLGDFNVCVDDENVKNFCSFHWLMSLIKIKQPTCFKNPENPSCIE